LTLGGRGAPGDGARDEDDELLHIRPLEVLEVAHVQRLCQYMWKYGELFVWTGWAFWL